MSTLPTRRLSLATWAVAPPGRDLAPAVLRGIQLLGRAAAEASAMALLTPPPLPERPEETRGHRA
jgi:hypothetical protein